MAPLLGLLGLGGLLFGLINLVHPTGRLGMNTRKHAGSLIVFSCGILLLAGVVSPEPGSQEEVTVAAESASSTSSGGADSSSATPSSAPDPSSTTPEVVTGSTLPVPPVPQADTIFAAPEAGPSGDPDQLMDVSAEVVTVAAVTDGDSIEVTRADGSRDTVRLIGVNAPEGGECWASEATRVLGVLTPVGEEIGLTVDESERDRFDRLLRYLWVGSMSVNEELVRRGAAVSRRYPPDTALADRLEAAQEDAKAAGLGLWAADACGPAADADLRIIELRYDAEGNDNENLNDEWIRIRNEGKSLVDLTGWGIKDESATNRYSFPTGFSLGPGESATVYSGCGDDFGTDLHWCSVGSAIWNNDGDTAFLTDPAGNTHTSRSYPP